MTAGHFCGAGDQRDYTLHFDIVFDKPFSAHSTWSGGPNGNPGGVALTFDASDGRPVTARVGISFVSAANAADNLAKRDHGPSFDAVRAANTGGLGRDARHASRSAAARPTSRIQFYTALYHALLHPNVFSDENGQYTGMDGKVHTDRRPATTSTPTTPAGTSTAARSSSRRSSPRTRRATRSARCSTTTTRAGCSQVGAGQRRELRDGRRPGRRDHRRRLRVRRARLRRHEGAAGDGRRGQRSPTTSAPGRRRSTRTAICPTTRATAAATSTARSRRSSSTTRPTTRSRRWPRRSATTATYTRFATRAQNWQNTFNPDTGYVQARAGRRQLGCPASRPARATAWSRARAPSTRRWCRSTSPG